MASTDKAYEEALANLKHNINNNGILKTKVPGEILPMGKMNHEMKGFKESIKKKPVSELKVLLARQEVILANKRLISKLPDKGAKLLEKKAEIERLLEAHSKSANETADMLGNLKLVDTEAMEWKLGGAMFKNVEKTSSDDSNVLRMLAAREVPDQKDLNELYFEDLIKKANSHTEEGTKFAPFNMVKRSQLDEKSKTKIPLKHADNRDGIKTRKVEVMPLPPSNYEGLKVQQIDLWESLELQRLQAEKLKDIQLKSAIDKLTQFKPEKSAVHFEGTVTAKMAYREEKEESGESDDAQGEDEFQLVGHHDDEE